MGGDHLLQGLAGPLFLQALQCLHLVRVSLLVSPQACKEHHNHAMHALGCGGERLLALHGDVAGGGPGGATVLLLVPQGWLVRGPLRTLHCTGAVTGVMVLLAMESLV